MEVVFMYLQTPLRLFQNTFDLIIFLIILRKSPLIHTKGSPGSPLELSLPESRLEGRKETRKEGRKKERKEGRKEGRKEVRSKKNKEKKKKGRKEAKNVFVWNKKEIQHMHTSGPIMTSISFSVVISFLRSPLRQSSITMKSS
jgi:hypothetical protein